MEAGRRGGLARPGPAKGLGREETELERRVRTSLSCLDTPTLLLAVCAFDLCASVHSKLAQFLSFSKLLVPAQLLMQKLLSPSGGVWDARREGFSREGFSSWGGGPIAKHTFFLHPGLSVGPPSPMVREGERVGAQGRKGPFPERFPPKEHY